MRNSIYKSKLDNFKSLLKSKELINQLEVLEACDFLQLDHQFNDIKSSTIDLEWTCYSENLEMYENYYGVLYTVYFSFLDNSFYMRNEFLEDVNYNITYDSLYRVKSETQKIYTQKVIEEYHKRKPNKKTKDYSHLYLIHDLDLNTLKIGKSKNPHNRIASMQTASSNRLELLSILKHKGYTETKVHMNFKSLHIKGEWFKYDNEILTYFGL